MTDLLDALYLFALENRASLTKEDKLQSISDAREAEQAKEKIHALLGEANGQPLTDYIKAENRLQQLELESIFRAGLSIGLELARL